MIKSIRRPSSRTAEAAAIAYVVGVTAFTYADALRNGVDVNVSALAGVLIATLAVGLFVGRWWSVLLPLAVALLSLPAELIGSFTGGVLPEGLGVAALGVGLRKGVDATRREGWRLSLTAVELVIAYVALAVALMVYLAATVDEDESLVWLIAVFLVGHTAFGLAFGRWRSLALVLLLPLFAIPVPVPEDAYEPLPLWFGMILYGAPLAALAMAVGIVVRRAFGWWTSA